MSLQAMVAAIALRDVGQNEKLLLIILGNYADQQWQCYPSVRRLADDSGMKTRSVHANLTKLEAAGLIHRAERFRGDGSRTSSLITIMIGPEDSAGGTAGDGRPPLHKLQGVVPLGAGRDPKPNQSKNLAPIGASAARGSRLPEGWEPEANIATLIGLSIEEATDQLERFRDYWNATPGAKGRKSDWTATWRNWCRTAMERRNGRGSPATRADAGADRFEQGLRRSLAGAAEAVDRRGRQRWRL